MPAVSFYINDELLSALRAKAKAKGVAVSRIISDAVREHLKKDEIRESRARVLEMLSKHKYLGEWEDWESLHEERTKGDIDRY